MTLRLPKRIILRAWAGRNRSGVKGKPGIITLRSRNGVTILWGTKKFLGHFQAFRNPERLGDGIS